jgi:MoxR-like ATPase
MMFKRFNSQGMDELEELEVDGNIDSRRGRDYIAGEFLVHAINTALALNRPLLVSGEPGCGKTELGFAIARRLGIKKLRFYSVKSDSDAESLFYDYDAVHRFHSAQILSGIQGKSEAEREALIRPQNFIRYRALGLAILDAIPKALVENLVPHGHAWPKQPVRSVVVIDEIDKATRDFPNDLLNEIDQLWFRVPELAGWVGTPETPRGAIPRDLRPIIVITSNLERQLPDAFLRRCVFHHIEHPDDDVTLNIIVRKHLEREAVRVADPDVGEAVKLFIEARKQPLDKRPGLAEFLEFVRAMGARGADLEGMTFPEKAQACLPALAKTTRDYDLLKQIAR